MSKLTKKLLFSYFIIVVMMAGLGVTAVSTLSSVNDNGILMHEDSVVPLSQIAEIAKYSENTRVQMVTAGNTKDPALTTIAEENIAYISELISEYEKGSMKSIEKKKFDEFQTNWTLFTDRVAKNISLIRNGKYEEANEGLKLGREPFTLASENLKELIVIKKQVAEDLIRQSEKEYVQSRITLLIIVLFAVVLAIGIGLFEGKMIAQPVKKISERAFKIANGDLTGEAIQVKNKDEIGDLARSFNEMNTSLRKVVSSVYQSSNELSAFSDEMAASSEQVAASATEVSVSMNQVAENTEKGNQSVMDVTKVLLELSSLIQIAKGKASSALLNSKSTYETASEGKEIVNESIHKMETIKRRTIETEGLIQRLDQYSIEIGHITQMITSIADQTNLLALNASIEAARAGDQGRGFAVVAEEVRKLAEQSNDGAHQVGELVRKISGSTGEAVQAMQQNRMEVEHGVKIVASAGHALDRILSAVSVTSKEVDGITDVTDEEVASSEKIVSLIDELSTVMENTTAKTEEVSIATEESTAAIETLSGSAEEVSAMAMELKTSVQIFKI
ncbi:methyl-accepting chemotaxis protein [Cytobacillus solani]|uniref:methyl-accepting chemotaxis protein n=1 Tax=Cytobacillus solani TaxID=1637975 RepID=UPI0006ABD90E|nr:methyl-accepting chemotaxis protein [Cytobacillus solani]USK53296.1 methyl-accepting chemotaxis protein [Cytobacillus solani]